MIKNTFKTPLKQWTLLKSSFKHPNSLNPVKCRIQVRYLCKSPRPNLTFSRWRILNPRNLYATSAQNVKLFQETENDYARKILPKLPGLTSSKPLENPVESIGEFESLLDREWRKSSAPEIVAAFTRIKDFTSREGIDLSDQRFDKLVDGLMDHCEHLKSEQIAELLRCLAVLPRCESINSHNFHDVWSCLDDVSCWKIGQADFDTMFALVELWYELGMVKLGDFTFDVIDRCLRRYKCLDRDQLVWVFFCYNVVRRRSVDFDFEHKLVEFLDVLTLDQLGVIAMGYFKSQSKVKLAPILEVMANRVADHAGDVNEITLSAILKILRYSQHYQLEPQLTKMLDALVDQIDRLSTLTCIHIALIGTGIQYHHPPTLKKTSQRIVDEIKDIRLKDIERTILANAMFDFDPETSPDLYGAALDDLKRPERRPEMVQYNRCMPCALHFLSIRKIYDHDLMDRVLEEDFINEVYGKVPKSLPKEIFALDCSIDVECPDYRGNRLTPKLRYRSAKWQTEFAPTSFSEGHRLNKSEQFFVSVVDNLKSIVGDDCVRADHILPHFSRADVVTCQDRESGAFVQPMGFENYVLGDVKRPVNLDLYRWFVFIVLIPNITDRVTKGPLGFVRMKARQFREIGYQPIYVSWVDFPGFSKEEKVDYLKSEMSKCV